MQPPPHLGTFWKFWNGPHLLKIALLEIQNVIIFSGKRWKKVPKMDQIWSCSGTLFEATKMELWKGFPSKRGPKSGSGPYLSRYGPDPLLGPLFEGNPFHSSILVASKRVPEQDQIWSILGTFFHLLPLKIMTFWIPKVRSWVDEGHFKISKTSQGGGGLQPSIARI